ncbi:probable xyloglucan endotransglucosylase/hydrolase protein 30 [Impatiens glandulifera]|uniref:probable xyloglucan endotransglucosylase/hydrolase protein 30 n=1 Tax=Impatiens glandulifera TaxID=253017 RepID=UPI001FB169AD|nr:probable xyloglucan endotransglucosylase/hydrolase protein 30 [Impatiens glandulifera]
MGFFGHHISKRMASLFIFFLSTISLFISATALFNVTTIPFHKGFDPLFGPDNIFRSPDDRTVDLILNQYTGSGFKSSDLYDHGLFSARIKLPSDYTAGIVVAFYTTNGDVFEKTHDELDFEFLGNIRGKRWRFQTNVYGNGSTNRGREERYLLWFDPSREFHRYSILWTTQKIIFYIDDVPIREIVRNEAMGGDFPSKPMALYATIWDASNWATSGGKYKVNYKYAPFLTKFTDLVLHGCVSDPIDEVLIPSSCMSEGGEDDRFRNIDDIQITPRQRQAMKKYRHKYMYYSYCYDNLRYPITPPECVIDPLERAKFKETGRLKFEDRRHRRVKGRSEVSSTKNYEGQEDG